MRSLKISLLVFILSINISAQWYDMSAGLPEFYGYAWAIDAYDSLISTGPFTKSEEYTGIPDSLYLTTDGGNSWFKRGLPNTLSVNDDIIDISIIGKNRIWFCTQGEQAGKIFRTTDGGFTWELQFFDTTVSRYMNYIEMFDSMNGMAMGNPADSTKPALFLKTTNGGVDWISQNTSYLIGLWSFDIWRGVDFVNLNQGYFYRNSTIYKTTNSGIDWNIIFEGEFCPLLKGYDENILLAEGTLGGTSGKIYRTLDGGLNWESNQFDSLSWGTDLEFIPENPSMVWYSSLGSYGSNVFFSNDTGKTWTKEFGLDNLRFNDIVFTDENNGWLLANQPSTGRKTRIFRTTNGGHGGIVISVDDNDLRINPTGFKLEQNYPNPFNPTTSLQYTIDSRQFVTLKVFDLLGREVATLVNEEKPSGEYQVEFDGTNLPSGIYFYRLKAGQYSETRKMVLLK
jgi:photosystem II stability/assembly factor-like uncharacterized protein